MSGEMRYRSTEEPEHVPTQLEVLRGVLLSAGECDAWMTLGELAKKTNFPEASISAQLRHLRKERHGGYCVEKRHRDWQAALRTSVKERVWEYRVKK